MHRTSIMLPDYLKAEVMREARHAKVSFGQYIREALEERLKARTKERDCFFAEESVFTGSAPGDLSKNHDDYLY